MKKSPRKLLTNKGFSLIELIVSMVILAILMTGMTAIAVSAFRTYQKSIAIKKVSENIGYALNLIAKDIRMGKIEPSPSPTHSYTNGGIDTFLMVTRNATQETVCYIFLKDTDGKLTKLNVYEKTTNCADGTPKTIVDLSGTGMEFSANSGFYSCPSSAVAGDDGNYVCNGAQELRKGWAEINFNIENPTMESDAIRVQTIVSSRDYGWENVTP